MPSQERASQKLAGIGVWRSPYGLTYEMYWRAERLLTPGLRNSQLEYADRLIPLVRYASEARWLDLGCGHRLFPDWMRDETFRLRAIGPNVVGIDLDWNGLKRHPDIDKKVFGNLQHLPFADGSFDLVSANMVVEHLPKPTEVLREVHRILKPGGIMIFHTPNSRGLMTRFASAMPQWLKAPAIRYLQGRPQEDVFPTHYRLNTPKEIRMAARQAGLVLKDLTLTNSSAILIKLGPVVLLELLHLRWLQKEGREQWRTNIVCQLTKPHSKEPTLENGCRA